jgi:endonuclease/exonuclease/phosphatase family metal-dependent hydrolase
MTAKDSTALRLRVATYNIHKGVGGLGPAKRLRIHHIAEALQEVAPDLVFLQEVQGEHRQHATRFPNWPGMSQSTFLAGPMGLYAAYRTNAITRVGEHGNALLSRYPIADIFHADISDHRFEQRGLLHCRVALGHRVVHCIVVHLGLLGRSRIRQERLLFEYVQKNVPLSAPLLIAGDFNDWQRRIGTHLRELHVQEVGVPATFPARMPWLALDRIYQRGFEVQHVQVLSGTRWARLSDHAPAIADLVLPRAVA